jgi:hypothetical protein
MSRRPLGFSRDGGLWLRDGSLWWAGAWAKGGKAWWLGFVGVILIVGVNVDICLDVYIGVGIGVGDVLLLYVRSNTSLYISLTLH